MRNKHEKRNSEMRDKHEIRNNEMRNLSADLAPPERLREGDAGRLLLKWEGGKSSPF